MDSNSEEWKPVDGRMSYKPSTVPQNAIFRIIPKANAGMAYPIKTMTLEARSNGFPCFNAFKTPSGMQTRYVTMKPVKPKTSDTGKRSLMSCQAVLFGNL